MSHDPQRSAPGDLVEAVVAAAEQVFGRPVTPQDDFLALGGDSIAAVELASLLEEGLDVDIDPQLVFRADTLADVARCLADHAAAARSGGTVARTEEAGAR